MTTELSALLITAATIGFIHTLLGPDHYLPFVMMSWSRKWSTLKTVVITILCGLGHVGGSVVLGLVGIAFGLAVGKLEFAESVRGGVAAWLLMGFGLAYFVWGLRRAYRSKSHSHAHSHAGDDIHQHLHGHEEEHLHVHQEQSHRNVTPWVLFVIFAFGPCEPLIPLLMYPAAKNSLWGLASVTLVFSITTVGTMLAAVVAARRGLNLLPLAAVERYTHAIAGATICLCGAAIVFLGL